VTICERISRTFGNVSVIESSAFEKLINEADVNDYRKLKLSYSNQHVAFFLQ
jgi:hypothetical protein